MAISRVAWQVTVFIIIHISDRVAMKKNRVINNMPNQHISVEQGGRCLQCGYRLDHLTENRCPECGQPFDPGNLMSYRSSAWKKSGWEWIVSWVCLFIMPIIPHPAYRNRTSIELYHVIMVSLLGISLGFSIVALRRDVLCKLFALPAFVVSLFWAVSFIWDEVGNW